MPEEKIAAEGSYFLLEDWGVIEITGPDTSDYLNRLTTLNFKKWPSPQARLGAFLTGKSGVVSLGYFQPFSEGFRFILPQSNLAVALEHIEKFHFAEAIEFRDATLSYQVRAEFQSVAKAQTQWPDAFIPGLFWELVPNGSPTQAIGSAQKHSPAFFEYLRTRFGMPRVGKEIDASVLVLEAGLERAVDRNKGCYPGQEVVERIFTYGQVNRKLLPVWVKGKDFPELPLKCVRDGKVAGTLVSIVKAPEGSEKAVGLAFMARAFWQSTETFAENGVEIALAL
jgi:folate-binding protein YgfZ